MVACCAHGLFQGIARNAMAALLPVFHILSTEEWNCTQPTLFRLLSSTLDLGPCVKEASFWVQVKGGVAQMVERSLSMREVRGSIPLSSIFPSFFFPYNSLIALQRQQYPFSHVFTSTSRSFDSLHRPSNVFWKAIFGHPASSHDGGARCREGAGFL